MDEGQRQRFEQWLTKNWKQGPCSVCQTNAWQAGQEILEMRPFSGGALTLGGGVYPFLPITCTNCGHSLLVNAVAAGLMSAPAPVTEEKAEGKRPKGQG